MVNSSSLSGTPRLASPRCAASTADPACTSGLGDWTTASEPACGCTVVAGGRPFAAQKRRKFDAEFREGAVRLVRETGKPIAQIARDLGVNEGTLGNWVIKDKAARDGVEGLSRDDAAELKRLRAENAELRMERDVLIGHVGGGSGQAGRRLVMS